MDSQIIDIRCQNYIKKKLIITTMLYCNDTPNTRHLFYRLRDGDPIEFILYFEQKTSINSF